MAWQFFQTILITLVVLQFNQRLGALTVIDQHLQYHPLIVVSGVQVAPANSPTVSETIFIRHSRSRANRYLHSESEKAVRGLQNTNETSTYQPSPNIHSSLQNFQNGTPPSTSSTETMSTATLKTISAAVTHKIRMLHKKQVMESMRKGVDGRKFHHRSLVQAEQLQGRPVEDEPNSLETSNNKNDLDDVSVLEKSKEMGRFYQSDEYLSATLPTILVPLSYDTTSTNKVEMSLDYHISNASESSTMVTTTTTNLAITKLHPVEPMLSQIHLPNKFSQKTKETNTEAVTSAQQTEYDDDEEQQSISALEPSGSQRGEQFQHVKLLKAKNYDIRSSSSSNSSAIGLSEKNFNLSTQLIKTDMKRGDFMFFSNGMAKNNSTSLIEQRQQLSLSAQSDKLEETAVDDALIDNRHANGFPIDSDDSIITTEAVGDDEEPFETNQLLEGVIDAANEDEIYDWDEISRNNRRNLMRGRDVVTKFLQIVETQHSLGSKCEAGTSLNLGEGVVDRYAQDRFRVEAEVAVNRANMLTRIFKMTSAPVQADVNLLHASVLSMVEFDDDIFAAGNCFDWNEHPSQTGLFCPFAYRLPPPHLGAIIAKDLANEYHYLGNTSEWFFQARKNAERVIARNEQYLKAFHLYTNRTEERVEDDTLAVKYEDGRWSKPYYDCGGGNIWMLTYTVPFFGYENGTYHFKGTSGIDIDLRRVDIDQCPQRRNMPGTTQPLNIFAGTDKCKQRTTMCQALKGLGFRRGSYKCLCRKGYYFPDTTTTVRFFNGSLLEEEYEKLMLGKNSSYNINNEYECLPCAEGCDSCEDSSPCIAALNWPMRTSILMLACTVIGLLPPAAWFTFRYQQVKVVRAASPALLRVIALGAFFIYCTNVVMYPNPNLYTCTARIWLREIGFSLTYGALMLKTWRISVIFRVRSAKAIKITDAALLKRLGMICAVIGTCLLVRTLVAPPDVVVGRTANDLKAFLCKTDWWDYTFTSMEVLFLAWGVRLCIMVRKAPSEFNESRFISMAIYNEFLLTCFLNVSMFFLQSPANPDLLYIIFFCHTQLTVTLLLCLIFGSKVYIVLRSGKSHQENMGMGTKATGTKFNFRPQVRTFTNPSTVSSSGKCSSGGNNAAETKLSDQEALEEIRQLSVRLKRIQEMAPPKGVAVMTISSLLDGLRTPGNMILVAAAASSATLNTTTTTAATITSISTSTSQLTSNYVPASNSQPPQNALPLLANMQKQANTACSDSAVNTDISTLAFDDKASAGYVICSRCLTLSKDTLKMSATCKELGSPQTEGSISFAKLKLDCMCSQPDDLHQSKQHLGLGDQGETIKRYQTRSAATNTPPLNTNRRCRNCPMQTLRLANRRSCQSLQINALQHICDNCKKKYRSGSNNSFNSSSASGLVGGAHSKRRKTQKRLGGSLFGHKRQQSLEKNNTTTNSKTLAMTTMTNLKTNEVVVRAVHSTDDIMFCTTITNSSRSRSSSSTSSACDSIRAEFKEKSHKSSTCSESNNEKHSTATTKEKTLEVSQQTATYQCVSSANITDIVVVTDECAGSSNVGGASGSDDAALTDVATTANDMEANKTNGNNGAGTTSRTKRPDKLVLDLNDRSKYSKEVSV